MKKLKLLLLTLSAGLALTACGNRQFIDTTYTFKYAEIKLPSGEVVKGNVESWKDYEDGDTIQVVINGKTYLTHINNVVLTT
ncbi:MAG: hypothetical protein Q3988_03755 [Gemella sp.]|nr:hypothetical protein [Gemella sp.]